MSKKAPGFVRRSHNGNFRVDWKQISSPESFLATSRLVQEISQLRGLLSGRLLDIGCAAKPYRIMFEDSVDEHLGIDMPQSMHSHSEIDVYATAVSLPFLPCSFDSILCTEVLEHTPDPYRAFSEIARVLKPGGHALVSTPFMYRIHERPYDFFRYTPYSFELLARTSGLEILELRERGGYVTVLADYLLKGFALAVSAANSATTQLRKGRPHLLNTTVVRLGFYLLQKPLAAVLKAEKIKSDTYTLGYVLVLRKVDDTIGQSR